jgi:hypothetical protein
MTSRYTVFLNMVDDGSGIDNHMPTALAEVIYGNIDRAINDMAVRDNIDEDEWEYASELLAFLICNWPVSRNLSMGEMSGLIEGMSNIRLSHPDLKPLDRFLFNGVTEDSALKCFSGLTPSIYSKYDGLNEVTFHLSATTEIMEEYWEYTNPNDRSDITGPADLLAAYEMINHAQTLIERVRQRNRNKESING